MTLKIKGTKEENPIINLERGPSGVCVNIDNCFVAIFRDDGTFTLHGMGGSHRCDDRWDNQ